MSKPAKRTNPASGTTAAPASKVAPAAKPANAVADGRGKDRAAKMAQRSEELHFKVTRSFKQDFKQTAKELNLKKTALLEKLLADWRERHPVAPASAEKAAADSTAPGRRARGARPTRRGVTASRRP
jgi:hypothetical protein